MKKKIVIIALAFVLCLSVIGGCFALYSKNATELNITFGGEDAVTLTLTADGGSLNFNGVKLSPTSKTATQAITLDVNTANKASLAGMNGKLTVTMSEGFQEKLTLSAQADSTSYNQTQLTSGVSLPLNDLPKNFTLTLTLKDISDADFKEISNSTTKITVSWVVGDENKWEAKDGGYYIVGDFCGWDVNKNAILMGAGTGENLADWTGTLPAGAEFKCVLYKDGKIDTWYDLDKEGAEWKLEKWGDLKVKDNNAVAPSPAEEIYVCVNSENGGHHTWAQTSKSKGN